MSILLAIIIYIAVLILVSLWQDRHPSSNETFFRAGRRSKWRMVAFGMIGASISGVTFVSVPGMVIRQQMTYLQTCMGFILGYLVVAFVLLPIYYQMNLTTIYTYILKRMGTRAYKTASFFFLLSKLTGTAVKFYLFCILLHQFVVMPLCPAPWTFPLTVVILVSLIWLYSRRGGIRTLVVTDVFQTSCMLLALILIIWQVISALGMNMTEAVHAIVADSHSRIFVFDDWLARENFWKQFLSGIFIVIVMTGLDQDMMQKNLTCKTLREAQKDMCTYGVAFVPVNLLFLSLGVLLTILASQQGLPLPAKGDELLPMFAVTGELGISVVMLFTIGLMAASLSTADSALTSLTTCCCIDLLQRSQDERLRRKIHMTMAVLLAVVILLFHLVNSHSLIDAVYTLVSYTYGPLLGLFAFGLLTHRQPKDALVPFICIASPLFCLLAEHLVANLFAYHFGYELLMLNGLLTFTGLFLFSTKKFSPLTID